MWNTCGSTLDGVCLDALTPDIRAHRMPASRLVFTMLNDPVYRSAGKGLHGGTCAALLLHHRQKLMKLYAPYHALAWCAGASLLINDNTDVRAGQPLSLAGLMTRRVLPVTLISGYGLNSAAALRAPGCGSHNGVAPLSVPFCRRDRMRLIHTSGNNLI
jgi:hypothetical protein